MGEWTIKTSKFDDPQYQLGYGDDHTIVVSHHGEEVIRIGVAEVIESCAPRFVIQHALECVKQGVWSPDADGIILAGEIPCWAELVAKREPAKLARKRSAKA